MLLITWTHIAWKTTVLWLMFFFFIIIFLIKYFIYTFLNVSIQSYRVQMTLKQRAPSTSGPWHDAVTASQDIPLPFAHDTYIGAERAVVSPLCCVTPGPESLKLTLIWHPNFLHFPLPSPWPLEGVQGQVVFDMMVSCLPDLSPAVGAPEHVMYS